MGCLASHDKDCLPVRVGLTATPYCSESEALALQIGPSAPSAFYIGGFGGPLRQDIYKVYSRCIITPSSGTIEEWRAIGNGGLGRFRREVGGGMDHDCSHGDSTHSWSAEL